MDVDYLIVGSGLTGATIGRILHDHGRQVVIIERRSHIGGNVHDFLHESGIRVHTYGPHYFRTSSDRIWSYVNRFSHFYGFEAIVMALIDGRLEPWPIQRYNCGHIVDTEWAPGHRGVAHNFEEQTLLFMPRSLYERFIHGYTMKQWGVQPKNLDSALASRFTVRTDGDRRLSLSRFQGLPEGGYELFMSRMLRGITVITGCDYFRERDGFTARKCVIYTGPIDEYFAFDLGRLAYRAQRRTHSYFPDERTRQPAVQINYPDPNVSIIRSIEWKYLMPSGGKCQGVRGTILTTETPFSPEHPCEYEYPFPDHENHILYERYRERIKTISGLLVCGRLGEYRYFDMDQAIGRAMLIAERLLQGVPPCGII